MKGDMDLYLAKQFVQVNGNAVELARLDYVLNNRPVPAPVASEFFSSQHPDGSWSPFWASDFYSRWTAKYRFLPV